jgi:DNA mismatch repair enzyme (predicted ATPase)
MLGEILKWKPRRLILFPEKGLLQVEFDEGKFPKGIAVEKVEDFGNIMLFKYSERVKSFKIYALLWEEAEFYIKRGIKVEEFRGSLMERWERYLRGWDLEEIDNIIGKVYVVHRDAERGNIRFVRVGWEVKKLNFPPRKNFLAVFKGEYSFQSAVKLLKGYFEGIKTQLRSPKTLGKPFENYTVKIIGDSVVIVNISRAAFRVIFDKLLSGRFSARNLSIPLDIKLPENVKEKLGKFGFKFVGSKIVSVPELPVTISVESIENFAKSFQNLEDEETFIRNLSKALSSGKVRKEEELISELFMCKNPYQDPEGRVITMRISSEEMERYFGV